MIEIAKTLNRISMTHETIGVRWLRGLSWTRWIRVEYRFWIRSWDMSDGLWYRWCFCVLPNLSESVRLDTADYLGRFLFNLFILPALNTYIVTFRSKKFYPLVTNNKSMYFCRMHLRVIGICQFFARRSSSVQTSRLICVLPFGRRLHSRLHR